MQGDSRIALPEAPPLLQDRIEHMLVEVGPISGAVKAKLVTEKILLLVMQYYVEEAAAEEAENNGRE